LSRVRAACLTAHRPHQRYRAGRACARERHPRAPRQPREVPPVGCCARRQSAPPASSVPPAVWRRRRSFGPMLPGPRLPRIPAPRAPRTDSGLW